MNPRHLYVHVPFCARRCPYCDFAVTAVSSAPDDAWLDAIDAELRLVMELGGWDALDLRTIYIGGGTPSMLGVGVMARLADRLSRWASWSEHVEWTAEANPESFDALLARDWRAAGVNRLSLGVQSFEPEVLRWMGRLHGPEGPGRAVAAARSAGLDNISLDLIFGLPARFGRDWGRDLRLALELAPEHISLYGLTAEPATPLGRWVREGREALADEDTYAREYLEAAERLSAAGYEHYEVSNFALPGRESRHNRAYWQDVAYLGLGPGAHSFLPPVRRWNVRDWADYARRVGTGEVATEDEERVDAAASVLERTWLDLRTSSGAMLTGDSGRRLAERWRAAGWAEPTGQGRVRLTPQGWLLLDRLALEMADEDA